MPVYKMSQIIFDACLHDAQIIFDACSQDVTYKI